MTHGHLPEGVAALVGGEAIATARVDALLRAIPPRDEVPGPDAANGADKVRCDTEPHQGRGEPRDQPQAARRSQTALAERQRRRWATQVVVADELAHRACAERGLTPPARAEPHTLAVDEADVADLGSIVAVVLAYSPAARTLLAHLTDEQNLPEAAVRDYYDRNRDRFLTQDALRRGVDPFSGAAPADFLPYTDVRDGIAHGLRQAAGRRAFFAWLDRARADVVYAVGHEHPGDPSHPDHEHRH
ncbi:peptidyl-prolyl cis-trans isomerase [Streptomyces sp. NBC_00286]|uniref:peptidyl-prolyl cis-trans isomerase n=1 Tax=Streptomyces sp. NBC_00286 TaxID=2975701 RepID=UPI002E27E29B|nr:peptidyl-prolyl cis-trans isomerase [Streptomyces sp. NBC_00286]